jgi:hypothetical protein
MLVGDLPIVGANVGVGWSGVDVRGSTVAWSVGAFSDCRVADAVASSALARLGISVMPVSEGGIKAGSPGNGILHPVVMINMSKIRYFRLKFIPADLLWFNKLAL